MAALDFDRAATVSEARKVLGKHARSFDLAGRLLPKSRLDDAAVVYAFCRLVDDAVDDAPDLETARAALEQLDAELSGQSPARPMVRAYAEVAERCQIPAEAARELFIGIATDLGLVRFESLSDLLRYAYRVAGTVGLMMSGILGVTDPRAAPFAIDLGIGMQLTNIARDVAEDARMDRVYLPGDWLRAAGLSADQILDGSVRRDALALVVRDLLSLAERYYASGRAGLCYIPLGPRPAIAGAAAVYRAIGVRILDEGADVMRGRTIVSRQTKLMELCGAALTAPLRGLTKTPVHDQALHSHLHDLPGAHALSRPRKGAET
ncbi:MAG: phytoene/squalene synthase family protein [Myxococcota bacterium]